MIGLQQHSRCPKCARILFLTKGNRLPPHRVPRTAKPRSSEDVLVPLTGRDQPWCRGIG